jgi:uracil-DNA glycosylase family 4
MTLADAIPAQQPSLASSYRLAVIGPCPNAASFDSREPFAGAVGATLWGELGRAGVPRQACYATNLSPTPQWQVVAEYLDGIKADLDAFRPNLVLLLGQQALNMFLSGKSRLSDWRGSVFLADSFLPGQKCLATHHPTAAYADYTLMPLVRYDFKRAADESAVAGFSAPVREFRTEVSASLAVLLLSQLRPAEPLAIDIEGGVDGLRCISFSQDPATGFIVPWDGWTIEEQCMVAPALAKVLGDPAIPKVLQNSLYDNFVLSYIYRMPVRGVVHDTMLSGWELYPELPKSLAVQASIWTREPFWKHQQGSPDRRTLWAYCCRDSAVTLEIAWAHERVLAKSPGALAHYQFNVSLLAPLLYLELRGMAYDAEAAAQTHCATLMTMGAIQGLIDEAAGAPVNLHSPRQLCTVLYKKLGYPAQHPRVGRKVDLSRWTADSDALAALQRIRPLDPLLAWTVEWKRLDRLREALAAQPDTDGRLRCSYNVVGDEAGRMKCYPSPTGTGADINLLPRDLFRADPGMLLFECTWPCGEAATLEAHYRRLGSPAAHRQWVKDQLLSKGTLPCASGHVRTFFGRRDSAATLADALAHEPAANLAYAVNRSLLALWLDPANRAAGAHGPDLAGDHRDDGGSGSASALPPGVGLDRLGALVVEPLHVWHGGLLVQGSADRREWIGAKLREWTSVPLTIAGQQVVLPCAVSCGPSWGSLEPIQ